MFVIIVIKDAERNRIKQWKGAELNTGVFLAELPLSEAPVLGDWTITAEYDEEVKKKKFFFSSNAFHFIGIFSLFKIDQNQNN